MVQTSYGWKTLKVCLIDSSLLETSESKGPSLSGKTGSQGFKGRGSMESVQEMGETTEDKDVLGIRNGIQVYSSFHTDVKEMEYKDLLTNVFTHVEHEGHEKLGGKYGYPQ